MVSTRLHKQAFWDALCLRYGWTPPGLPTECVCGKAFSPEHALSCPTGGYPAMRHNDLRDLTASLLREVAHDVQVEPHLQPLTGETFRHRSAISEDGARLDVAASGVWGGRFERALLDIRVFNPHARSNRQQSITATYRKHEAEKRRAYEERVREVEHASFSPIVFSASGGYGKSASAFFKRVASMLADKRKEPVSSLLAFIRSRPFPSLLSVPPMPASVVTAGHGLKMPARESLTLMLLWSLLLQSAFGNYPWCVWLLFCFSTPPPLFHDFECYRFLGFRFSTLLCSNP
eukprot:scpid35295/ scgid0921/ 